jgi:hypothetical protein
VIRIFEFEVTSADSYDITLGGAAELGWRLYAPGSDAGWRSRQNEPALATGTADGTTRTVSLQPGWHGIAVYRDGGMAAATLPFTVRAALTPNPVPVLTELLPPVAVAGDPGFALFTNGVNFAAEAVVRWNGSDLSTTFVNSTHLIASLPAPLLVTAGTAAVTVFNPPPGGGTSNALTFTIENPPPALASISPPSRIAGSAAFTLTLDGSGFNSQTVARWNGSNLPTTYVNASQVTATVAAALITMPGTATVTAFNPPPGGGISSGITFTIEHPVPAIGSLAPSSVVAGGPGFSLTVDGSGFFNGPSVVRWNGTDLPTAYVSATQLTATAGASLIERAGTATVQVFNPAPGGGLSAGSPVAIVAPAIASITPATIPVMNPLSPAILVTITGTNFLPTSLAYANSDVLPTGFVNSTTLTCTVGPSVPQTQRLGGLAIAVENGHLAWSNAMALQVGSGSNRGTIVRHPLDPLPGETFSVYMEGGHSLALYSLVADLTNPLPLYPFPDPAADFVLNVRPYVAGDPTWIIFDGIGIFGPPLGLAYDAAGIAELPGFVAPALPLGIDLAVQLIFLDPTASFGYRITFARWPDSY